MHRPLKRYGRGAGNAEGIGFVDASIKQRRRCYPHTAAQGVYSSRGGAHATTAPVRHSSWSLLGVTAACIHSTVMRWSPAGSMPMVAALETAVVAPTAQGKLTWQQP